MILVCAAVLEELEPILGELANKKEFRVGGRSVWEGQLCKTPVMLLETGLGMVNATQSVTAILAAHPIDRIIVTGCAGGFDAAGVALGDVVVATEEIDVHLGVESTAQPNIPDRLPMPVFVSNSRNFWRRYPASSAGLNRVVSLAPSISTGENFNIRVGPCISVSTITASQTRTRALTARWHPVAEAMEGAAIAHVAIHYGIEWLEIRGISNPVGQRDRNQWDIPSACAHAAIAVAAVIADAQDVREN